jgi:LmbE family N-acetylglucosaminyl deacetylase
MFTLAMLGAGQTSGHVLCLGAHCDDIEIGCGGTVLRLVQTGLAQRVTWVVFSSDERRAREAEACAERILTGVPSVDVRVQAFRDGFFPYQGGEIKEYFENLKRLVSPDVIFTHYRDDRHQDHRVISDLTWNTFRDHAILEYEVPKYDGDLGSPNVFVELTEPRCREKVEILMKSFQSQADKTWFSEDVFLALLRLRGMECHASSGYAEGFYGRKVVIRDQQPAERLDE